jgi:hypothetical protein
MKAVRLPSIASLARPGLLALALVIGAAQAGPGAFAQGPAPGSGDAAGADYQQRLDAYRLARAAFDARASAYWSAIADKRRIRNAKRRDQQPVLLEDYVLTQPPVYAGPPRPVDPLAPPEEPPPRKPIPVIADVLQAAAAQYGFAPQRPRNEGEFKRAYARVAAAAGLTQEQIVRIYSFEVGGNGTYDLQSGISPQRPNAPAISTALGYNQLLNTNSVHLLAEKGELIMRALKAAAAALAGPERDALERKIAVVQRMIAVSRTVPNRWSEHEKLAATPPGLAMHALQLDIHVGPLLQTQKLLSSIEFARRKGYAQPLTAAELEMMNLTGDGNGFDMVTMPAALRDKVPTSNFFQRGGYERNPVASRNNVVALLIAATDAKMDRETKLPGAQELAAAYPK